MNSGRKYYFLKIAETLNITRAAEQLAVSQPSLSQYLGHLEKELGMQLVDRSFTPLLLTKAGKLYYEYLKDAQLREELFYNSLEALKSADSDRLRIGIPLQNRDEELGNALLHFFMERPTLDVRVWEGSSTTVRERIIKGELDIGFGHAEEMQDEQCVTRVLKKEKIVILCSKHNPIVQGLESDAEHSCRISPELLNSQLFYQMSPEYHLCEVELAELKRHGVVPQKRIVMSSLRSIIEALLRNPASGFAYMPDDVLNEHWPQSILRDLAFLRLDEEDFTRYFCMKRKKGRAMSKNAAEFWEYVEKECRLSS